MRNVKMNRKLKIVVMGDPSTGKTCLWESVTNPNFVFQHYQYIPTIFENYDIKVNVENFNVTAAIWDTSDYFTLVQMRSILFNMTDVILLCFAIDDYESFLNISRIWAIEAQHAKDSLLLLCGLKCELRHDVYEPYVQYDRFITDEVAKKIHEHMMNQENLRQILYDRHKPKFNYYDTDNQHLPYKINDYVDEEEEDDEDDENEDEEEEEGNDKGENEDHNDDGLESLDDQIEKKIKQLLTISDDSSEQKSDDNDEEDNQDNDDDDDVNDDEDDKEVSELKRRISSFSFDSLVKDHFDLHPYKPNTENNNKNTHSEVEYYVNYLSCCYFDRLAAEVIHNILCRLPTQDFGMCARVCRLWNSVVTLDKYWLNRRRKQRMVTYDEALNLSRKLRVPYMECSVSTGFGTSELLRTMLWMGLSKSTPAEDSFNDHGSPYMRFRLGRY
eukprot:TRINITY_DN1540_c0_g1_i2.p1 TRINITY_DN1540_c0_g1~~TRINITY_DN1540_c0_g1_i2.p1  ORF type:complete len:443 (-),score=77.15 TRINITY_DN1540_c0_g1_i2:24-1352(-)